MATFNIPDEITIGFQERRDTYKDRLAFVTYKDTLGQLKSLKSWDGWRDKNIDPVINDNKPREGFILNRNGGGSWGHFERAEFVRVYDPLGFEIEISIDNLMKIILHNGISKGNGIDGELVYGWETGKKKLSLLPVSCDEYIKHISSKVDTSSATLFKKADLKEGFKYLFKNGKVLTYLGKHTINVSSYRSKSSGYIFTMNGRYCVLTALTSITHTVGEDENFNQLMEQYSESVLCTGIHGTYSFEEYGDVVDDVTNYTTFMKIDDKIYHLYYWRSSIFDKDTNKFIEIPEQEKNKLKGKSGVRLKVNFNLTNGVVEEMHSPGYEGYRHLNEILTDLKNI